MITTKVKPVFLVDDSPMQRQVIEVVFKRLGIDLLTFSNSKDFLIAFKEIKPQICLIDLNIDTDGEGFELVHAIRNVYGSVTSLLVISAANDRKSIAHALELGADDFICKPLDKISFLHKISKYISSVALIDELDRISLDTRTLLKGHIELGFRVKEVHETGLILEGVHLFSKKSILFLRSSLIRKILPLKEEVKATVVDTWIDPKTRLYYADVEFLDISKLEYIQIQNWIKSFKEECVG